jgi:hypothetical protein
LRTMRLAGKGGGPLLSNLRCTPASSGGVAGFGFTFTSISYIINSGSGRKIS